MFPDWSATRPSGSEISALVACVPLADLPGLYGAATVVVYASRYEGFGLPPIEAMACGAAVVSTPVPSITEVVGDGAATFRPGDVTGLAAILRDLAHDEDHRGENLTRDLRGCGDVPYVVHETDAVDDRCCRDYT